MRGCMGERVLPPCNSPEIRFNSRQLRGLTEGRTENTGHLFLGVERIDNMWCTLRLILFFLVSCTALSCAGGRGAIVEHGSTEYEARVRSMKISPEKAYEAAVAAAHSEGSQVGSKQPLAIWGNSYVFGKRYKDKIVL